MKAWACKQRQAPPGQPKCNAIFYGGSPSENRLLKHARKCKALTAEDKRWAAGRHADKAPGAKVSKLAEAAQEGINVDDEGERVGVDGGKKAVETKIVAHTKSSKQVSADATLRLKQNSLLLDFTKQGREDRQTVAEHHLIELICVRGLVPEVLGSQEWKDYENFMKEGGPNCYVKTPSPLHFLTSLIPVEAAWVRKKVSQVIASERFLTLSFDGLDRHSKSIYTTHATTQDRVVYFLDGRNVTGEAHDTQFMKNLIVSV